MFKRFSILAAAAFALVALAQPAAAAGILTGKTLQVTYLYPNIGSPYAGPSDFTGGGPAVHMNVGSDFATSAGDDTITLADDCSVGCAYNGVDFNGVVISDAYDTVSPFTGVSILSNDYLGFDPSRITFDANNIYVNFSGLNFSVSPSSLTLLVNSEGGVPEPSSWALMIAGCGLVGAALRRRAGRTLSAA